uniref:Uncharacterized protein n=1 Tax=viral metagenome TaxID=1070528 RepID=A0A6C0D3G1_9ZZZZ
MEITSKNSQTAKSGFKAEYIFRTDETIQFALEAYFGKKIVSMNKVHGKKYDTQIIFQDGSKVNIQNKKIERLGGRGDSFDRRHIRDTFQNQFIRKYLTLLTLYRNTKTSTTMSVEQKRDFIQLCNHDLDDVRQYISKTLIGHGNDANHYWCIMKTNKTFSKKEIYMISSETLKNFIDQTIQIDIKMKTNGTCLHLSPYIALQRKGGGNTDCSPNHIQAKFKITEEILKRCVRIM